MAATLAIATPVVDDCDTAMGFYCDRLGFVRVKTPTWAQASAGSWRRHPAAAHACCWRGPTDRRSERIIDIAEAQPALPGPMPGARPWTSRADAHLHLADRLHRGFGHTDPGEVLNAGRLTHCSQ